MLLEKTDSVKWLTGSVNNWLNIGMRYTLRHTHATILLNDKIPVKVIADRLGNTPQMIHTVYGHVLKEMEQQTVEVFSNSLKLAGAKSGASI